MDVSSSTFNPLIGPRLGHEIEMIYMPFILDNQKHWKMFEDDQYILSFMEKVVEFSTYCIDHDENAREEELSQENDQ